MEPLEPVDEHWPVPVVEHILTDLDDAIGPYPDQISVKRRMVESAQRDAVRNGRLAQRI